MKIDSKKLMAIDGNSLLYRAFFALPEMTTKKGVPTGAVYGFLGMLLRLLDYKPTHLAVAFDLKAPTFRHKKYSEYKAGRAETPNELVQQFDTLKRILRDMDITVIECEGYEADDILGTLSRMADAEGMPSLLVTGDKDALQLIDESTHVILTRKGISEVEEYDIAKLKERYGLLPSQMTDLKGLMGDNSDNLPGVKGVGEKTALKLLEKYGDLETAITRGTEEEKGALQKKLIAGAEDARLSKFLGTIVTDAPIDVALEDCTFSAAKMANAVPALSELQLRTIIDRLPDGDIVAIATREYAPINSIEIENYEQLAHLVNSLGEQKQVAVYLDNGISICCEPDTQYTVKVTTSLLDVGLNEYDVLKGLKPLFENKNVGKVLFDAKKIMHDLGRFDITVESLEFDAMIADYLLNAVHPSNTLFELANDRQAGEPCACTLFRLYEDMKSELQDAGLMDLFQNIEMPLIEVLFDMEKEGFRLDVDILKQLSQEYANKKAELEKQIYEMAGFEFNIQSPKQLSDVLFTKMLLPPPKQKTKYGFSTNADVLEVYEDSYPIVKLVLEYRFVAKLKSTFIDGLMQQINQKTNRVHTTFNQNVTATGRISSTEPNLQNIPTRSQEGREIRRAFVAGEGKVLLDADYSQIELRVLAHMSGDERMIAAFNSGEDIHSRTASEVFGTTEVTREQRSAAKAVNFGIVYGISEFGLAKQLGIARRLAAEYIKMYLTRYVGVDAFMKNCIQAAYKTGFAYTMSGRRRPLFELKSSNYNVRSFGERIAMNMPVQGTAADIIKIAMVSVYKRLKEEGLKARLILQIHDELIVEAPVQEADRVSVILNECMEQAFKLNVPLIAEVNEGNSWYESK